MMKSFAIAALCLAFAASIGAASADPGKDKHKGGKRGERTVVYDDGLCKLEQKWGKKGDYKEKVECRGAVSPVYPYYGPDYPGYGYRYR